MRSLRNQPALLFSDASMVSCNWLCFFSKKAARGDIENRENLRERACGDLTAHWVQILLLVYTQATMLKSLLLELSLAYPDDQ